MRAADLVFGDGDRVIAMGRLVRDGDEWWLDSRRVLTLASRTAGGRSELSTKLVGGETHIKAFRKQDAAAAKAWLHVIGVWRRGAITVEAIGAGPGRPDLQAAPPPDVPHNPLVDSVASALDHQAREWGIEAWAADAVDEFGTPFAVAELFRVSRELATWADEQPDGLVRLDPSVRRLAE